MDMDEEKNRGTDSQENTVNDSSGDVTYHYTRPQYGQYRFHEEQQTTREDQDEEDTSKVKATAEDKDRKPVPFKKKLTASDIRTGSRNCFSGNQYSVSEIFWHSICHRYKSIHYRISSGDSGSFRQYHRYFLSAGYS